MNDKEKLVAAFIAIGLRLFKPAFLTSKECCDEAEHLTRELSNRGWLKPLEELE